MINNSSLIISGNIPEDFLQYIKELTKDLKPRKINLVNTNNIRVNKNIISYDKSESLQAHLIISVDTVPFNSMDIFTVELINTILGKDVNSRLYWHIREQEALAYDFYMSFYTRGINDIAQIIIYAVVDNKNIQQTYKAICNELNKLRHKLINTNELGIAKTRYYSSLMMQLETSEEQTIIKEHQCIYGTNLSIEQIISVINDVSAVDIQRVAKQIFTKSNIAVSLVKPICE